MWSALSDDTAAGLRHRGHCRTSHVAPGTDRTENTASIIACYRCQGNMFTELCPSNGYCTVACYCSTQCSLSHWRYIERTINPISRQEFCLLTDCQLLKKDPVPRRSLVQSAQFVLGWVWLLVKIITQSFSCVGWGCYVGCVRGIMAYGEFRFRMRGALWVDGRAVTEFHAPYSCSGYEAVAALQSACRRDRKAGTRSYSLLTATRVFNRSRCYNDATSWAIVTDECGAVTDITTDKGKLCNWWNVPQYHLVHHKSHMTACDRTRGAAAESRRC
jgi:hypothetical protein